MLRAALVLLLGGCILPGILQAQRAGAVSRGSAARSGIRSGLIAQRGFPNGFAQRSGLSARRSSRDSGSAFFPYLWPIEDEGPYPETETAESVPSEVVLRPPATPAPKPHLIEVPGAQRLETAKALPPTIFVMTNGERLETRRFLLTASNLSVSIDRRERTVPLEMVDLNATIAANRERGIDLRIPADRNEISISF